MVLATNAAQQSTGLGHTSSSRGWPARSCTLPLSRADTDRLRVFYIAMRFVVRFATTVISYDKPDIGC